MFIRWGRFVARHRWATLVASALVLLAAALALAHGGTLTTGAVVGIEADRAEALANEAIGLPGDASFTLVFLSEKLSADDPAFDAALTKALAPLKSDPRVASITSPVTVPPIMAGRFVAPDRKGALAVVALKGDVKEASKWYPELRAKVDPGPFTVLATGHLAFMHDLDDTLGRDLRRAEAVSLPLSLLVLVLVFGSVVAAALPIGVGALAVVSGVAAVLVLSHRVDMAQYTLNVVSLIGLGVAIDYSLFIVTRHRDELAHGAAVEDAIARALDTAGRAVAFSGVAVMVGLSGLLFFHGSYLRSMGIAGAVVVALAVLFALSFLPALLAVLGPNVDRLRVRPPRLPEGKGAWHAIALWVMRHPLLVLVPTLALLLALGAPFLRLRLAATDVTVLPHDTEARQGYDAMKARFPTMAANRVLVVVQFPSEPVLTPERIGALYDASRRIAQLPGVAGVESAVDLDPSLTREQYLQIAALPFDMRPPELDLALQNFIGKNVALLWVLTTGEMSSPEAQSVVRGIREQRQVGDGRLLVGGKTAGDLDAAQFVKARTPRAVAFVVTMTYVVLFLLLGSVLLPLKAVLMNLLSIAGSFGAMVWIFQEGHLRGLLHFEPRPLEPALPVLLFCLVFGLSMDYEVLLLSRMQEEYLRTRDNTHAVAVGLERSAGLITSAAAIMVAVFLAFALARVVVVKAMGVGLAVAVALDATLVRVLIVPATMRLFGDLNWWAPAPIARLFASFRARHGAVPHGP